MLRISAVVLALIVALISTGADARHRHKHKHYVRQHHAQPVAVAVKPLFPWLAVQPQFQQANYFHGAGGAGPRPSRWCGWYMMQRKGVSDRRFWRAAEWARWGRPAAPGPGVVVVWPHHVGEIVGPCEGNV